MRSESTRAFGNPRLTNPTLGTRGVLRARPPARAGGARRGSGLAAGWDMGNGRSEKGGYASRAGPRAPLPGPLLTLGGRGGGALDGGRQAARTLMHAVQRVEGH